MQTQKLDYVDGNVPLEAYLAYDDKIAGKRPLVLIAHDWTGRSAFTCQKADKLAELGYIGFALDMYGKNILGTTNEEKAQLMQPFKEDRRLLQQRITAALMTAKKLEYVDTQRIAVIGFCFGGLCALDLARSGADINGVVSFHGLLDAPSGLPPAAIKAKILALHGHDDPMGPPAQVAAFEQEMTAAKVDWQLHVYGNTLHAFTNPLANDHNFGTVYNTAADKRSWLAMQNFLHEIFNVVES